MTLNEYLEILGAVILTFGGIGLISVVSFMMLLMWSVIRESWHE